MSQIATGSPVVRRTSVIIAVAAALLIGALIGRETAGTSDAAAVRPASAIALTGTDSADAARRAEVYEAVGAFDAPITLVGTDSTDATRRAAVYDAMAALRARHDAFGSTGQALTDAERRALVYRLVTEAETS